MKKLVTLVATVALATSLAVSAQAQQQTQQGQQGQGQQQMSPEKQKELRDIYNNHYMPFFNETDLEKKIQMGKEFIQKYPDTPWTQDVKQRVLAAQGQLFSQYLQSQQAPQLEKAMSLGKELLAADTTNVAMQFYLGNIAGMLAKSNNYRYKAEGEEYSKKAIAAIEGGAKPQGVPDDQWAKLSKQWLSILYQGLGLFAQNDKKIDEAIGYYKKSVEYDASDPVTFYLLGFNHYDRYVQLLNEYNKKTSEEKLASEGKALFDKTKAEAEAVIEYYARLMATTEGRQEFEGIRNAVKPTLEDVYKAWNGNSLEGLPKKIESYKTTNSSGPGN